MVIPKKENSNMVTVVPPPYVMRFYGNLQYALETIGFKQITFLHPDKLNDPFDPYLSFNTDFEEDYHLLISYAQQCHKMDYDEFRKNLSEDKWKAFIEYINGESKKIRNSTYIFSASAGSVGAHPRDDLYMWSHYGNGHRGVAIEFDTSLVKRSVFEKTKRLSENEIVVNEVWRNITYKNELPQITREQVFQFIIDYTRSPCEDTWLNSEPARILDSGFFLKSKVWALEKEWRIIWQDNKTRLKVERCDLLNEAINAIYFGCCIDDRVKDDLVFETKRNFPNAKIFQGKKQKGKFALAFKELL